MSDNIIIYNASAGSGKTYQLALNYLKLLNKIYEEGEFNLKNLLAITFTNKASFEMKERIISFLKEIYQQTEKGKVKTYETGISRERAEILLEEIFLKYDSLQIKTIDSFLLNLYRALSYELDMPTDFQIKTYLEEGLIEKALNKLFESAKKMKGLLSFLENFVDHLLANEEKLRIDMKNKLIKDSEKIFQKVTYKKELLETLGTYQEDKVEKILLDLDKKEISQDSKDYYLILYTLLKKKLEEVFNRERMLFIGVWKEILSKYLTLFPEFIPWIYVKLGNLEGIIIDEFQDTDRVQWEAILPIVEDVLSRNKVFVCACDPKQSIFQWKGGDPSYPIKVEVLGKNYRSAVDIVKFNNLFFSYINKNLELKKELLEELVFGKEKIEEKEEILTNVLKDFDWSFENVIQEAVNDFKGEVKCKFLKIEEDVEGKSPKEKVKELIKKEILDILRDLEQKKDLDDVAILVRINEDITELSSFLISEGFKVIGSSFLKIKESPLINAFFSLLKFLNYSEDEIALAGFLSGELFENSLNILSRYCEFKLIGSNLSLVEFLKKEYPSLWENYIEDILSVKKYLSLYELCQYIVKKFRLEEKKSKELAYLYKFLSIILDFSFKGGDLEEFLEYWERYSEDELEMPKDKTAIKILTLHLAKGLEFNHVILPLFWEEKTYISDLGLVFYNGNIYKGRKEDLPNEGKIGWYLEKAKTKLELFNLLYVGFTRAIKTLYILIPEIEKTKDFSRFEVTRVFNKIYSFLRDETENFPL
jgi:ATP-dependent exoDNAse (exonuclease V) beta subunit